VGVGVTTALLRRNNISVFSEENVSDLLMPDREICL